ncbi:ABC-type cobalt transport system, permease component CbiQ and related transporters [Peptoniphilus harei]|uniref:energy-coupling factor transporter transmembrane component T family protein n=1 Tax=Peptoniphilus harei TaxID=54005 RepID=UPI000F6E9889|nr:energy-coupling factor transporter transmembrane component T [Peptoniphilus harei]QQE47623.1 energy-coupling factor transporter transmembrane protein EcfT [Peptoniphilus harei]VEJ33807.1 ABC-type cobalt transport system, permease component CbiQ and related transporters [Peptoniphilus harei]
MKIDFRTKIFLTNVIGIVAIEGSLGRRYYYLGILIAIFPYLLALFDRKWSLLIKGLLYTSVAILGQGLLLKLPQNFFTMILNLYVGIIIKVLPGFMMGYYALVTTKMSDLVYSLQKISLPNFLIIPVSVMFRFFYSIKEDYMKINEAMYMHGLTMKNFFKDPAKILEYKFVPLLMITSKTADDVAISAMTRGMRVDAERSSISDASLKLQDYVLMIFGIFIIILFIRVKIC